MDEKEGPFDYLEKLSNAIPKMTPDELRLMLISATLFLDDLTAAAMATRDCPGRYWRESEEFSKANAQRKRARKDVVTACPHDAGARTFTRNSVGPRDARDNHLRRLCDGCASALARDRKNGLLNGVGNGDDGMGSHG